MTRTTQAALATHLAIEADRQQIRGASFDYGGGRDAEGWAAFIEKRPAQFQGR